MKCKHEWRFRTETDEAEYYSCIYCLASARVSFEEDKRKVEVEECV